MLKVLMGSLGVCAFLCVMLQVIAECVCVWSGDWVW